MRLSWGREKKHSDELGKIRLSTFPSPCGEPFRLCWLWWKYSAFVGFCLFVCFFNVVKHRMFFICKGCDHSSSASWSHSLHNPNTLHSMILKVFYILTLAFVHWTTFLTDSTFWGGERKKIFFFFFRRQIRMIQTAPHFQSSEAL